MTLQKALGHGVLFRSNKELSLQVVMALKAAGLYDGGWESWRDGWANIPG
jgi:hypothetical protein